MTRKLGSIALVLLGFTCLLVVVVAAKAGNDETSRFDGPYATELYVVFRGVHASNPGFKRSLNVLLP